MAALPVLCVVAVVVFIAVRVVPGDPAALVAGDSATPEQVASLREAMGLSKPLVAQFGLWASGILSGDLGVSLISGKTVVSLIGDRFGPTLALTLTTITLAILVAVPVGVLAAWRQGMALDRLVMAASVVGFSVPVFIVGYVLVFAFARTLQWLPVQGYKPLSEGIGPFFERLLLPTIALSLPYIALIARIVRSSVIEVMKEDFIRTARAKGASESTVLLRHALLNAAIPIVTVIGISIATLMGGVVVTESVFNIPGLGRLVLESILSRDFSVLQGLILLFAVIYVGINLVIDILYVVVDPRIKY